MPKAYLIYETDYTGFRQFPKLFDNEEKAQDYCTEKNQELEEMGTKDEWCGWAYQEFELE